MILIEPFAYHWELRKEEEMKQIDVERTHSDVLKASADASLFGEVILIVAENHDDHQHESVHGCSLWQVGPLHLECVQTEDVGTA